MGEGFVGEGEVHHVAFASGVVEPAVLMGGCSGGLEHLRTRVGEDKTARRQNAGCILTECLEHTLSVSCGYSGAAGQIEHMDRRGRCR